MLAAVSIISVGSQFVKKETELYMGRYIIRRLLQLIFVVFGISFILFTILSLTPGDPATLILGEAATAESIAAKRAELGLDDPFFVRYFSYLYNIFAHGDFGNSYRSGMPVFKEVFTRFPNTLKLALLTITISAVLGILFGVLSAVKQYTWIDNATLAFTLLITSVPSFWLGLMLIILFAVQLGWLPVSGGTDSIRGFILPAIAGSVGYMANTIRQTRTSMLDVIHSDYITMARAKGCNEKTVTFKHALRNALLPVVTLIGINIGWQLGGTIIIEQVFTISGIGTLMITSVRSKDIPVVLGCVTFVALLASLINLATDILYAYIDPRVKSNYTK